MLISITERCRMGCSHCMDGATPEGNDMDMQTFKDAIKFFNSYGALVMLITGGEPTENPLYMDMLEYALENTAPITQIVLTTNAMNLVNNKEAQLKLLSLSAKYGRLQIQVTHVPQYYPIHLDFSEPFFQNPPVMLCDEIESMYPQGRAVENRYASNAKASKCFNIRSAVRSYKDLADASKMLAARGKFCTPRVNWNGDLKLGESKLCPTVATIYDDQKSLIEKICDFRCDKCGLNKNLPIQYRHAIGEV